MLERVLKYLWGFLLFTFPFSVRFLVYEKAAYRFGHFNPWVSEFIYGPEIILWILFGLWLFHEWKKGFKWLHFKRPLWLLFGAFVLNAILVTLWKGDAVLAGFFLLRMAELTMVYLMIIHPVLTPKKMTQILLSGFVFQILLGFLQVQLNHSLGLSWLGESLIGPDILNVAKNDLADGLKQVRAYGTFLHPNILAGYLVVLYFLSHPYLEAPAKIFWFGVLMWGIYLTGSQAAFIVALVVIALEMAFAMMKNKNSLRAISIFALVILILGNGWLFFSSGILKSDQLSYRERLLQNEVGHQMFLSEPWGVGIRNFTLRMEDFSDVKLLPWQFQPVHNTYFLFLNELGIQGLILFVSAAGLLIWKYTQKSAATDLFVLLFLMPFDHFLWDSFAGLMLLALTLGFFRIQNDKHL